MVLAVGAAGDLDEARLGVTRRREGLSVTGDVERSSEVVRAGHEEEMPALQWTTMSPGGVAPALSGVPFSLRTQRPCLQ